MKAPYDELAHAKCPCGCLIRLGISAGFPVAWSLYGPDVAPSLAGTIEEHVERATDRAAVAEYTFSPSTVCDCGRRYRALDAPPWIEAAGEG